MGEHDHVVCTKQAYRFDEKVGIPDCIKAINTGNLFFKKSSINKF